MSWIIETPNPFEPFKVLKHSVRIETTIREWVESAYPKEREFPFPTICLVNGTPLLRKDWDRQIQEGDVINFVSIPGEAATWFIAISIVLAAASVAVSLFMPIGAATGEQPTSDPVFSIKGQSNSLRLGEPIEVCYGRNRLYPSYASRPYYEYRNNDQFQFSLFCLGQGEYDISAIQIGDTSINLFQEVEYEVIPPGSPVTLFPANVYTAAEVGGQEMKAPNKPDYIAPGWIGPFAANPSGTETQRIQVDMIFPKGIYYMGREKGVISWNVRFQIEYREIDDAGAPLGAYVAIQSPYIEIIAATTTPQRRTYQIDVPAGRYEVRARRMDNAATGPRAFVVGNDVMWEGLRSYIDTEQNFGDVTLLAVIIRATNNLNEQTGQKFNVICTRKLPTRESTGEWSEPVPTRSIVWAFVDVFRSLYGGRIQVDAFFDWDALETLDALYSSRGEYFDWIFRDPITVWDAALTIAHVGRAVPLLSGSLITMKRDGPLSVPVAMFNQENIVQGSFQWDIKLWDLDEHDSLQIEYTEPTTGYKPEVVTASLPGDTVDHPKSIRLVGVQDRTHAYRLGLYLLALERYLRENAIFETGLEGYIPTYGDLIAVRHDVPKWGQGGYVVHAERGAGTDYHLWLSEPLVWGDGSNSFQMSLRGKQGQIIGPFTPIQKEDPKQVLINSVATIDFLLDGTTEPMLFLFGVANDMTKMMKVVKIEPQGGETIRITAVNEEAIVHSFDSLTPPALSLPPYPITTPDLPEIADIEVSQIDGTLHILQVSWTAAYGAQYYVIQISSDGENWTNFGTTNRTSFQTQYNNRDFWVRVAAVNIGQGPWIEDTFTLSSMGSLELFIPWEEDWRWGVRWLEVLNGRGYRVKIYDMTESEPVLKRTVDLDFTIREYVYDWLMAEADDNLVRLMRVEIDVFFDDEETGGTVLSGVPVILDIANDIPLPVFNPGYELIGPVGGDIQYRLFWEVPEELDIHRIMVWVSTTNGFDPQFTFPSLEENPSELGWENISTELTINIALTLGAHTARYWRVALFDVWGNEYSTNVIAQQTIPAYP